MKELLYMGIDVDDKNFHGAGFSEETGEILEFKCKPTNKALLKFKCKPTNKALLTKLRNLEKKGFKLKTCYEATYYWIFPA